LKPVTHSFAVVLVNLGTPDAPTAKAVRRYLKQFLSDPRVIDIQSFFWWFILNGVILPLRSPRAARAYQKIWWESGSPLRVITQRQQMKLTEYAAKQGVAFPILFAMNYGQPSLKQALDTLASKNINRILFIPLYPQYSATTTASVFDQIASLFKLKANIPEIRMTTDYHTNPGYINALADSIKTYWNQHGKGERLIFSFHGIPKRYAQKGDPYPQQCFETAQLVSQALFLPQEQWQVTFQSRFGPAEWVKPYTLETLSQLPKSGITQVDVVSPGFAADCLETLEELQVENKEAFYAAGGKQFSYIPALNDNALHIEFLFNLILQHTQDWRGQIAMI
jgi:ferrochelatase